MATARFTAGAVLSTIGTLAGTVDTTLGSVSKSVGMFNAFVDKAAEAQRKRYAIEAAELDDRLIDEAADIRATHRKAIDTKLNADPVYAEHYAHARKDYQAILDKVNGVNQSSRPQLVAGE